MTQQLGKILRARQVPSPEETWEHFGGLLERLLAACRISAVATWRQLQAFLHAFKDRRPGAFGPATACIYMYYFPISQVAR